MIIKYLFACAVINVKDQIELSYNNINECI